MAQTTQIGVQTFIWDQAEVIATQGRTNGVGWGELFTHKPTGGPNLLRSLGNNSVGSTLQRQHHLDALGSVQAITGSAQSVESSVGRTSLGISQSNECGGWI